MGVPFLDLKLQYNLLKKDIDEALGRVVTSQFFVLGPEVQALEVEIADFLGASFAVGVASGTDALLLPLRALDPEDGDEVIVPAFTFFATAGAVWNAGFTPVFCDVDPHTFNVTAETLEAVWTDRTRAVVPVHLFGQMAPMAEIRELCRRKEAFVLEDAAQAIGARQLYPGARLGVESSDHSSLSLDEADSSLGWMMAGVLGDAGAFSFFPTKNLGGFGDGGLVTTSDEEFAEKISKLRIHGGKQMYHHEMVGTNSRLDALQAAVLRVKLPHLEGWAGARQANAALYDEILGDVPGVAIPAVMPGNSHVYNQYTLKAHQRDELRDYLSKRGIGTGLYYPLGLHLQECFSALGGRAGDLPVTEALTQEVMSLPIFPELSEGQVSEVGEAVREFYSG
ncbi:MAG: DegT/DnrJ/EryC1/StrS family aminotransferase [Gemmatimonadetes bacterium]|nr:DegT/DnrJ/EryC1/StrS family aminotransferase [Gemmatimonadota bacterium]